MIAVRFCHCKDEPGEPYRPASWFKEEYEERWSDGFESNFAIHKAEFESDEACEELAVIIHANDLVGGLAEKQIENLLKAAQEKALPSATLVLLVTTEPAGVPRTGKRGKDGRPVFPWCSLDYVMTAIRDDKKIPSIDEILAQFRRFDVLPALSILCQGWLSVYWTLCPSPEGKADNLQKAVGFGDIPPEYRSLLAGGREKIEAPTWWECLPSEGLAEAILHELDAEAWSDHDNIKVLLDRMKAGITLDSEAIVRNAFVEISEVLKRSAE
jgi:hypothetical protein